MQNCPKIAAALIKVQKEIKNPFNSDNNPITHSRYASLPSILNTIRPILALHGLSVIQNVGSTEGGNVFCQTLLIHESGEYYESDKLCSESDVNKRMNTVQEKGSSITYLRRYQLSAFLNIASEEDNDGNISKTSKGKDDTSKPNEKPNNKPNSKPENKPNGKPGNTKPSNKPKDKPGNGKPINKTKPVKTTTKDGVEIEEQKGSKPGGEPNKEINPLVLKIKGISAPLYKKLASVKAEMQGNITKEMIVKEAQNMLGELLSQDQLGLIKEELDC